MKSLLQWHDMFGPGYDVTIGDTTFYIGASIGEEIFNSQTGRLYKTLVGLTETPDQIADYLFALSKVELILMDIRKTNQNKEYTNGI